MSGQERSLKSRSTASSPHRYEHRSEIDHSYSHSRTQYQSTSSKQCYSETNQGETLIAGQRNALPNLNMSVKMKLKRKISGILTDFKVNAGINERMTTLIVKEVEKYCYYQCNDKKATSQPTTSKTTTDITKTYSLLTAKTSVQQQTTSTSKTVYFTPKTTNKVAAPKKIVNRVVESVKGQGKNASKLQRELLALVTYSDGFVVSPPSENKRTPKRISRYDDIHFKIQTRQTRQTRQSSNYRQSIDTVQKRTIQRERCPRMQLAGQNVKKLISSSASKVESVKMSQKTTTTATPTRESGNFKHLNVTITHLPLMEIKLEPNE
ncbi:uncharacterized protein LOC116350731 isoform X2 [Contarinia nasturtii]|uniref:uncharacterized protein LOC116350731 isoform X2 n=1 Tax=Contarinia nasturtii TaxID=265458 RepID=UPI0012D3BF96|nr:uncharacterized protein LOC116350731 isoform X2 [Contarinia nasturtii]